MFAESQFVFDLKLPPDFKPRVGDGEVQDFYLVPIDKVGGFHIGVYDLSNQMMMLD